MEYIEIINKLIGDINSVGSSHVDCYRYENLEKYCELLYDMVNEIFNELFKFIRWEDAEPTSIEELLKNCEVTENAENR